MNRLVSIIAILVIQTTLNLSFGACVPSSELICNDTPVVLADELADNSIDAVLISKSERKMYLLSNGEKVKTYDVALGGNPVGHKVQEGDEKTPEGRYMLDYKKMDSSFYKAIHISYPNKTDIAKAEKLGVDPGGFIMIHGQKNGLGWLSFLTQPFNWTNGCIAVTNSEMDEIIDLVEVGTPIEIKP